MSRPAQDGPLDDRARLERHALELAFEANRIAELGHAGAHVEDVLASAGALEREAEALAPAVDPGGQVLEFVRLVLRLLPQELEAAAVRDASTPRPRR